MKYKRRYEYYDCPLDKELMAAEGDTPLRVKLWCNPTFADVKEEEDAATKWHAGDLTDEEYLPILGQRVADWNFQIEQPDGSVIDVAAPGAEPANWTSFYLLEPHYRAWLFSLIRFVHLPKVRTILLGGAGITDSNTQTESQETEQPTVLPSSPSPAGSASAA